MAEQVEPVEQSPEETHEVLQALAEGSQAKGAQLLLMAETHLPAPSQDWASCSVSP